MWSLHEDCINVIRNSWNLPTFGNPLHILSQNLKHLKNNLKDWNRNVFDNVHNLFSEAEQEVSALQTQIDNLGLTDNLLNQRKLAPIKLDLPLAKQEAF